MNVDDAQVVLRWLCREDKLALWPQIGLDPVFFRQLQDDLIGVPIGALVEVEKIVGKLPPRERTRCRGAVRAARKRRVDEATAAARVSVELMVPAAEALRWVRADLADKRMDDVTVSEALLALANMYWRDVKKTPPWLSENARQNTD